MLLVQRGGRRVDRPRRNAVRCSPPRAAAAAAARGSPLRGWCADGSSSSIRACCDGMMHVCVMSGGACASDGRESTQRFSSSRQPQLAIDLGRNQPNQSTTEGPMQPSLCEMHASWSRTHGLPMKPSRERERRRSRAVRVPNPKNRSTFPYCFWFLQRALRFVLLSLYAPRLWEINKFVSLDTPIHAQTTHSFNRLWQRFI